MGVLIAKFRNYISNELQRAALICTKNEHKYDIETSPVEVKEKDYAYKMSYNYSYSNDAMGSVIVLGVVIVAGVVCVALAPATGGASLIVPLAGCV